MKDRPIYQTSDLPLAAYLVVLGFECLGSRREPESRYRRLFIFEYDSSKQKRLDDAVAEFANGDPMVPVKDFYYTQKKIKRYLDDPF